MPLFPRATSASPVRPARPARPARRALAVGALLLAPATAPGSCQVGDAPLPAPQVLVQDRFDRPDGLLTNEYAHWNPGARDARHDTVWLATSGSLFATGGAGSSGAPDDRAPNATSSNGTGSAVLRVLSRRADLRDVEVRLRLRVDGYVATPSTPAVAWDGVHVFLRYAGEEHLYYASANRRDGTVQIKKKVPGGPSNGGTYHTLASGRRAVERGRWHDVRAIVVDRPDGSVGITLEVDGELVAAAVDRGTGGPPIRQGRIGLRGDNTRFLVDDLVVTAR